jgi:antitoxin VapB
MAPLAKESLTEGITAGLKMRLARQRKGDARRGAIAQRLNRIAEDCAAVPDVDPRSPDEIIGYDHYGVPR